jgi:hypothetical protein
MPTISSPPSSPAAAALPAPGEVVRCRTRAWLVDAAEPSPHGTKVSLSCLEDDAQGEELEVLWEAELDTQIIDRESWKSIGRKGFDDPRHFSAFVRTLRWPTDEEFTATLLNDRLYRTLTRKRLRMFLRALEQQLQTDKTEDIGLKKALTIEHLMPRQWKKHWPLPGDVSADAEDRRDHIVHTLGNLTLLTNKLNPAVSNGPWEKKFSQISRHSLLRLNKEIEAHDCGTWDEAAIHARGKALAALACKTWPRPHPTPR